MLKFTSAHENVPEFQAAHAELNGLVEQILFFLTPLVHQGAKIECALHDQELRVAADAPKVSEVLFAVIESSIRALKHLANGSKCSTKFVIRTGPSPMRAGRVCVELCDFAVSNAEGDQLGGHAGESPFLANLILRQGLAHAGQLAATLGGEVDFDPLLMNLSRVRIRVELPSAGAQGTMPLPDGTVNNGG